MLHPVQILDCLTQIRHKHHFDKGINYIMKLSSRTVQILKNFSQINQSIQINPGSVIRTWTPNKTLMSRASVEEDFPQTFCIFDLSKFLSVLSLFEEPELTFNSKFVTISSGRQHVNYTYCDPSHISIPPDKNLVIPEPYVEFTIEQQTMQSIMRAASILQSPELTVHGDGVELSLNAMNSKDPTADNFKVVIGTTTENLNLVFKVDNMKLMAGNYQCKASGMNIGHFVGDGIEYWVAAEATSTFSSS